VKALPKRDYHRVARAPLIHATTIVKTTSSRHCAYSERMTRRLRASKSPEAARSRHPQAMGMMATFDVLEFPPFLGFHIHEDPIVFQSPPEGGKCQRIAGAVAGQASLCKPSPSHTDAMLTKTKSLLLQLLPRTAVALISLPSPPAFYPPADGNDRSAKPSPEYNP